MVKTFLRKINIKFPRREYWRERKNKCLEKPNFENKVVFKSRCVSCLDSLQQQFCSERYGILIFLNKHQQRRFSHTGSLFHFYALLLVSHISMFLTVNCPLCTLCITSGWVAIKSRGHIVPWFHNFVIDGWMNRGGEKSNIFFKRKSNVSHVNYT